MSAPASSQQSFRRRRRSAGIVEGTHRSFEQSLRRYLPASLLVYTVASTLRKLGTDLPCTASSATSRHRSLISGGNDDSANWTSLPAVARSKAFDESPVRGGTGLPAAW